MRFVFCVRYSQTTVASDYSGQTETDQNKIKFKTKPIPVQKWSWYWSQQWQQAAVGQSCVFCGCQCVLCTMLLTYVAFDLVSFLFLHFMFWVKRIAIHISFSTKCECAYVLVCACASTNVIVIRYGCTVILLEETWCIRYEVVSLWALAHRRNRSHTCVHSQGTMARMAFIRCWRRHVLDGCGRKLWSHGQHM